MSSLVGKRVVITRAAEQAQETAAQLSELGAIPIVFPTIQFVALESAKEPLTVALNEIKKYNWLIFTSQNGVRFFDHLIWEIYAKYDGVAFGAPPKIAAIGVKTAALLKRKGFHVNLVPDEYVGESLVDAMGKIHGQHILLPRAKKGRPELVELMRERGAIVDEIALYDTISADPTPESLAELNKGFDAVLFTSPSTVHRFAYQVANCHALSLASIGNFVVGCIGEVTRRSAEAHNLTVNIMPEEATMDSFIAALVKYYNYEQFPYSSPSSPS